MQDKDRYGRDIQSKFKVPICLSDEKEIVQEKKRPAPSSALLERRKQKFKQTEVLLLKPAPVKVDNCLGKKCNGCSEICPEHPDKKVYDQLIEQANALTCSEFSECRLCATGHWDQFFGRPDLKRIGAYKNFFNYLSEWKMIIPNKNPQLLLPDIKMRPKVGMEEEAQEYLIAYTRYKNQSNRLIEQIKKEGPKAKSALG